MKTLRLFAIGLLLAARIARPAVAQSLDPTFTSPLYLYTTGQVYCLGPQQADGKLLVGGSFNQVEGGPRNNVACLSTAGALAASFASNASVSGTVRALAIQPNGRVLLNGNFNTGSTPVRSNLARVLDNGQLDATFGSTANPNIQLKAMVVQSDGAILLAGPFTTVSAQARVSVARITAANVLHVRAPAAVTERTAAWPVASPRPATYRPGLQRPAPHPGTARCPGPPGAPTARDQRRRANHERSQSAHRRVPAARELRGGHRHAPRGRAIARPRPMQQKRGKRHAALPPFRF